MHLVHLANWILDIWVTLDTFYYPKDKKIFHRTGSCYFGQFVNVVHLVHLANWVLDIWVKLDMFYYPEDKKIFHRN